jgi:hypothetical protein
VNHTVVPGLSQYTTFTLLALYFYKALNRVKRGPYTRWAYAFFGVTAVMIVVLVCVQAVFRGITADANEVAATNRWNASEQITVGVVFFAMSLFYLTIAYRVRSMTPADYSRALIEQSQALVARITFALFIVFVSRSVFNFASAAGAVNVTINTDAVGDNIASFAIYAFWELFPVSLLLVTIAQGSSVSPRMYRKRQFGVIGTGAPQLTPGRMTGDAHSTITSYDVYADSPPHVLSRESSYMPPESEGVGVEVVATDAVAVPVESPPRSSSKWRKYQRRGSKTGSNKVEMDNVADLPVAPDRKAEELAQPLLDRSADMLAPKPSRSPMQASVQHLPQGIVSHSRRSFNSGAFVSRGVGRKGLAVGGKARIVSLGGDEPGYGDSYPVYTEFVGSYGAYESSVLQSPNSRPHSARYPPASIPIHYYNHANVNSDVESSEQ